MAEMIIPTASEELCEGHFAERAVNVLAFGLPGRGKTHFLSAIGYELIQRHGKRVLFVPSYRLVQRLLEAKRDLRLAAEIKKLEGFEVVIIFSRCRNARILP